LAARHHPDGNGDNGALMARVNAIADRLEMIAGGRGIMTNAIAIPVRCPHCARGGRRRRARPVPARKFRRRQTLTPALFRCCRVVLAARDTQRAVALLVRHMSGKR
jgi:hypothetical protein